MKKILYFEDKAMISYFLSQYISNLGHCVDVCPTPSETIDALNKKNYDIYIIDLNVAAIGLNDDQIKKTQNGLRTGWVLLTDIISKKDPNYPNKTIVFSDYISSFKDYINSDLSSLEEKELFNTLKKRNALVEKNCGVKSLKRFLL